MKKLLQLAAFAALVMICSVHGASAQGGMPVNPPSPAQGVVDNAKKDLQQVDADKAKAQKDLDAKDNELKANEGLDKTYADQLEAAKAELRATAQGNKQEVLERIAKLESWRLRFRSAISSIRGDVRHLKIEVHSLIIKHNDLVGRVKYLEDHVFAAEEAAKATGAKSQADFDAKIDARVKTLEAGPTKPATSTKTTPSASTKSSTGTSPAPAAAGIAKGSSLTPSSLKGLKPTQNSLVKGGKPGSGKTTTSEGYSNWVIVLVVVVILVAFVAMIIALVRKGSTPEVSGSSPMMPPPGAPKRRV